jgi:uncharacterized protein
LPEGAGIVLDPTGKKSGRGAYVCPTEVCVMQALKKKSLERSLKTPIPDAVAEELRHAVQRAEEKEAESSAIPSGVSSGPPDEQ